MIKVWFTTKEQMWSFQEEYDALLLVKEHWPGDKPPTWRVHLAGTMDDAAQIALTLGVEVQYVENWND